MEYDPIPVQYFFNKIHGNPLFYRVWGNSGDIMGKSARYAFRGKPERKTPKENLGSARVLT
jgi:hypothetical protein